MSLDTHKPLISVVIPSFNHAKWIGAAIDSVISQTYKNFELLIIDNNSTDFTDEILANYSDARIRVVKVENLGSIAFSRNRALDLARGEWIAFLDSDDSWKTNKLQTCSEHFSQETDFIYHDLTIISSEKKKRKDQTIKSRKLMNPIFLDLLIGGNTIATSSVVLRSQVYREVNGMRENPELIGTEDFNTWLRVSKITDKFKLIPISLGYYRVHDKNVSLTSGFKAIEEATKEFLGELNESQKRDMQSNLRYLKVRSQFLQKKYDDIRYDLLKIVRYGRFGLKLRAIYMLGMRKIRILLKN
jgi:glycosyltransferase involved in cell wall biosynthesis